MHYTICLDETIIRSPIDVKEMYKENLQLGSYTSINYAMYVRLIGLRKNYLNRNNLNPGDLNVFKITNDLSVSRKSSLFCEIHFLRKRQFQEKKSFSGKSMNY